MRIIYNLTSSIQVMTELQDCLHCWCSLALSGRHTVLGQWELNDLCHLAIMTLQYIANKAKFRLLGISKGSDDISLTEIRIQRQLLLKRMKVNRHDSKFLTVGSRPKRCNPANIIWYNQNNQYHLWYSSYFSTFAQYIYIYIYICVCVCMYTLKPLVSKYIFILDCTPGFNGFGKDDCKRGRDKKHNGLGKDDCTKGRDKKHLSSGI